MIQLTIESLWRTRGGWKARVDKTPNLVHSWWEVFHLGSNLRTWAHTDSGRISETVDFPQDLLYPWPADLKGYEIIEFREPKAGEPFLSSVGGEIRHMQRLNLRELAPGKYTDGRKRYILRKLSAEGGKMLIINPETPAQPHPDIKMRDADGKGLAKALECLDIREAMARSQIESGVESLAIVLQQNAEARWQKRCEFLKALGFEV